MQQGHTNIDQLPRWQLFELDNHQDPQIKMIATHLRLIHKHLESEQMHLPGKDVDVPDPETGNSTTQVGYKIESVRGSCKTLRRTISGVKVDYQRDRASVTLLEKYMGNDLRHVNGARKLLEQIINRLHVDSDEKFPAQFFQDLLHIYSEQMIACKAKIEELDHSLRMKDDKNSKSLNVLQDIMQSHFKYLWSVAEKIKVQIDAITEEKYLFEHQVCADAPTRFDEADKNLQRIDGYLLALEDQLGIAHQGAQGAATPMGAGSVVSGAMLGSTAGSAAVGGGLLGGNAVVPGAGGLFGASTTPASTAGGGLFGASTGAAAPAAGGGLFGAGGASGGGGGGGLFGGAAAGGVGAGLNAPVANTGKKGRKGKR